MVRYRTCAEVRSSGDTKTRSARKVSEVPANASPQAFHLLLSSPGPDVMSGFSFKIIQLRMGKEWVVKKSDGLQEIGGFFF